MCSRKQRCIPEEFNKPRGDVSDDICSEMLQMRNIKSGYVGTDTVTNYGKFSRFVQLSQTCLAARTHARYI